MTLAILLNTSVLALDQHNIDKKMAYDLEIINTILSWIFFVEMIIKLIGLGLRDYCNDNFNIFDGSVVIISLVEIIVEALGLGGGNGAISSLRAVRLLRVFKLARSWVSFRDLL